MKRLIFASMILILLLSACAPAATPVPAAVPTAAATVASKPTDAPTQPPAPANKDLILSTTTSTQDSGLLDDLIPVFEQKTGYKVKTVAVGSGQALKMGEDGNADVLLVHSPAAEKEFMTKAAGIDRRLIMHNDFILVGPAEDPAGIKGMKTAAEAFKQLAEKNANFASRGDNSGTHTMELGLWKSAAVDPKTVSNRVETGQGMGATLKIASEKKGYTLTDRATYLAQKANLQLVILVEKDPKLLNVYHVITVNPEKYPKMNLAGAKAFADFLVSAEIQKRIGEFGTAKYGEALFFSDATKTDADLGLN
jgi:tungstate transport system substrate-binding protein